MENPKYMLTGVHYSDKKKTKPTGFRVIDLETYQVLDIAYNVMYDAVSKNIGAVGGIELGEVGTLKPSNGDFSRYTSIIGGHIQGKGALTILGKIFQDGFEVYMNNKVAKLSIDDTIKAAQKLGIANGKLVEQNGFTYVSAIKGEYPESKTMRDFYSGAAKYKSAVAEAEATATSKMIATEHQAGNNVPLTEEQKKVAALSDEDIKKKLKQRVASSLTKDESKAMAVAAEMAKSNSRPKIVGSSNTRASDKIRNLKSDGKGGMVWDPDNKHKDLLSVEQMLSLSMMQMQSVKPFFFAALKVIPRIETSELPTMAVSLDKMYFNPEFVVKLAISELNFVTLHEISHIMMKHHTRCGTRDPELWNIATDLYINKAICDEFNVVPGGATAKIQGTPFSIKFADGGLYSASVDVEKDTPEKIYAEMLENMKKQGNKSGNQSGNQNGQNGQNGQQSNSGGNQSQQSGQQSGPQSGSGNAGGQQGQPGTMSGSTGGQGGQGQQAPGNADGDGGSGGNPSGGQKGTGRGPGGTGNGSKYRDVNFRGQTVAQLNTPGDNSLGQDIIDDKDSSAMSSTAKEQKADSILQKTDTIYKQVLESSNQSGKGKGSCGVVEAFVEEELIPKVNWRALIQNRLIASKSEEKSLSTPDRRFIHSGLYVEGTREEEDKLEGIKLCIDTSGSMSDKDIAIAIGQVMQLCKLHKTQADLIYWDDGIQDIVPFAELKKSDLKHYRAMGRGGTNPECLFEEFSKRDYKTGKKVKPSMIIIFTDGYFPMPSEKYKGQFGKDTVWVLCSESSMPIKSFQPPFGKVAQFMT